MCFGQELRPSQALGRIGISPLCQRQSRTLGLNLDCAEVSLFSMQVLAFSSRYKGVAAGIILARALDIILFTGCPAGSLRVCAALLAA